MIKSSEFVNISDGDILMLDSKEYIDSISNLDYDGDRYFFDDYEEEFYLWGNEIDLLCSNELLVTSYDQGSGRIFVRLLSEDINIEKSDDTFLVHREFVHFVRKKEIIESYDVKNMIGVLC